MKSKLQFGPKKRLSKVFKEGISHIQLGINFEKLLKQVLHQTADFMN